MTFPDSEPPETSPLAPTRPRRWKAGIILTFAVMLAFLGLLAWGLNKSQARPRNSGKAPDFTLTGFDKQVATLSKQGVLRGVQIGPLQSPILDQKIDELLAESYR